MKWLCIKVLQNYRNGLISCVTNVDLHMSQYFSMETWFNDNCAKTDITH